MSDYYVTCERMKELEKMTDARGLSYYQMMENAGTCAFELILEKSGIKAGQSAIVFCGKGNNGGDGFVVARKLCEMGVLVTLVLVDGQAKTADAITNYGLLCQLPVSILDMTEVAEGHVSISEEADIIVDAIYGTGFHGQLNANASTATSYITAHKSRAYALDIPSGLSGDMAETDVAATDSAYVAATITFHARKPVHLTTAGRAHCGEILVADIGIVE